MVHRGCVPISSIFHLLWSGNSLAHIYWFSSIKIIICSVDTREANFVSQNSYVVMRLILLSFSALDGISDFHCCSHRHMHRNTATIFVLSTIALKFADCAIPSITLQNALALTVFFLSPKHDVLFCGCSNQPYCVSLTWPLRADSSTNRRQIEEQIPECLLRDNSHTESYRYD